MRTILATILMLTSGFIYGKTLDVQYTKTDISCFGKKDGVIELNIIGGKAPYVIKMNDKSFGTLIEGLSAGVYKIEVNDAKGLSTSLSVTINSPKPLMISYNKDAETIVDGYSGSLNLAIEGGNPWHTDENKTYIIRLDGKAGIPNSEVVENGIHSLEIEDASGCKLKVNVNLEVRTIYNGILTENVIETTTYNGLGHVTLTVYKNSPVTQINSIGGRGITQ